MPDARAPRLLCVEVHESKPLSYMTETAAGLLAELGDVADFVPDHDPHPQAVPAHPPARAPPRSTRSAPTAGTCSWTACPTPTGTRAVTARLASECAPLDEVREHLEATADPAWVRKHRVAEDLFAYLVVERELLPEDWVKELAVWAENRGWTVSLQGRKIYAVPKPLTKSAAMREVARRTGADPHPRGRRLPARRRPAARRRPRLAPGPRRAGRRRLDGAARHRAARSGASRRGSGSCGSSWTGSGRLPRPPEVRRRSRSIR